MPFSNFLAEKTPKNGDASDMPASSKDKDISQTQRSSKGLTGKDSQQEVDNEESRNLLAAEKEA